AWLREPADRIKGWKVGPYLPGPDRLIGAARTGEGASIRGRRGGDRCVPAVSGGGGSGRAAPDLPGTGGRADPGGRAGAGAHGDGAGPSVHWTLGPAADGLGRPSRLF